MPSTVANSKPVASMPVAELPVTSSATKSSSALAQICSLELLKHRQVLLLLVKRDQSSRYRGSLLGRLWPLVHPLGQLLIYTFVFAIVLKIRFADNASGTSSFAVYFMAGLIPWSIFSESLSRSSTVILENPNLVTKIVFPTEVLPLVNVFSALSTQLLATLVLFVCASVYLGKINPTVVMLPLLALPLVCFTAGLSWFLASLGVYIRDTRHVVALALQAGMYATPILYPSSKVPEAYRWILAINPLAGIVDDFRSILLAGHMPDWNSFEHYTIISLLTCFGGLYFFLKTKKSFADVM